MNFQDDFQHQKNNRRTRWMVSYSDFATVLLAVFIVFYVSTNVELIEAKAKIAELERQLQERVIPNGPNLLLQGVKNPSDSANIKVIEFEKMAKSVQKDLKNKSGIEIIQEQGGLTIRLGESLLFDVGSAEIKQNSKKTLDEIANVLTKNQNQIKIEGHSDNIPIKTAKYSSNWELSSARASNIVAYLTENKKLDKKRFQISSFADNKPISENSTQEGRSKNRRVDIIITN